MNNTDEELVNSAKTGDQSAIEILLDKYKTLVRSVTRMYFLVGADRDDLLQEGMIGLYKSVLCFDGAKHASFKSFAEMCIKRQVISAIKHATRLKNIPLNSYVSLSKPLSDDDNDKDFIEALDYTDVMDPEDILISQETLRDVENKMKELLSTYEMDVIKMFLKGASYQQIADMLGKEYKSIDNALQRVKKKLEPIIPN